MKNILVETGDVVRCTSFARVVCASYTLARKTASKRLRVHGQARMDQDIETQFTGRVAEFAACKFLGLDPIASLNWSTRCDDGADFRLPDGRTVDVKASNHPGACRLIWPVSKNSTLHQAADVFIFARVPSQQRTLTGQGVELLGCVTRDRFIRDALHSVGDRGIVNGTRFMWMKDLDDLSTLRQN